MANLLEEGPARLRLYADASFASEVGIGCWAYAVPAFSLSKTGVETGCSNNRLEFAAVVAALADATTIDQTGRPLEVNTDSEFVVGLMGHAARRVRLPERKSYAPVADLYARVCDIVGDRTVTVVRRADRDPVHALCDQLARQELRRQCTHPERARTVLRKRAEARRAGILTEIRNVERLRRRLEDRLLSCEIEIAALQDP
jgi:ribonuclease HI